MKKPNEKDAAFEAVMNRWRANRWQIKPGSELEDMYYRKLYPLSPESIHFVGEEILNECVYTPKIAEIEAAIVKLHGASTRSQSKDVSVDPEYDKRPKMSEQDAALANTYAHALCVMVAHRQFVDRPATKAEYIKYQKQIIESLKVQKDYGVSWVTNDLIQVHERQLKKLE